MHFVMLAMVFLMLARGGQAHANEAERPRDLTELSLGELADLEVTSVGKRPRRRVDTPAAIHVITRQDLQRSGVATIQQALRMVPGVHVARIDASRTAIGVRGFTSRLSRSQLVLMDGRSLYDPLFAGTYWEVQDTPLEDIERIEVVRGPGGTLWGANAVNGVINIVTRSARDTHGGFVTAGAGNEERGFLTARQGGAFGGRGHYRVFGKVFARDAQFSASGEPKDDWHMGRGGFRTDLALGSAGTLMVQGGAYAARVGQSVSFAAYEPPYLRTGTRKAPLSGGHTLLQWTRPLGTGDLSVQGYYDRTSRREVHFSQDRDTFDVDVEHAAQVAERHRVVAGLAYRYTAARTFGVETVKFVPPDRSDDLYSVFLQDEVTIVPARLRVDLGAKLEHNTFSGFELQPSARLLFTPTGPHTLWAAATRAVRTPTPTDRDLDFTSASSPTSPVFLRFLGNPRFEAERVHAYEAGYRFHPSERAHVEASAFYNRYPNLLSVEPGTPFVEGPAGSRRSVTPLVLDTLVEGHTHGLELAGDVRVGRPLRLHAGYAYLRVDLGPSAGSRDTSTAATAEGSSPRHSGFVRASLLPHPDVDLDATLRMVGELPAQRVPAYNALDARLAWRPRSALELALVVQNSLDAHHPEFAGGGPASVEIERSIFGRVSWQW